MSKPAPVDMLQAGLDALRDFERAIYPANGGDGEDPDAFWHRDLASLRFALAGAIEGRRTAHALERIALALEMIARREEVQP